MHFDPRNLPFLAGCVLCLQHPRFKTHCLQPFFFYFFFFVKAAYRHCFICSLMFSIALCLFHGLSAWFHLFLLIACLVSTTSATWSHALNCNFPPLPWLLWYNSTYTAPCIITQWLGILITLGSNSWNFRCPGQHCSNFLSSTLLPKPIYLVQVVSTLQALTGGTIAYAPSVPIARCKSSQVMLIGELRQGLLPCLKNYYLHQHYPNSTNQWLLDVPLDCRQSALTLSFPDCISAPVA